MLTEQVKANAKREIITDSYNFEYFISNDCFYVDKTEYCYKLVSSKKRIYFFSRPRRFGKSLTISTLECIFQGKRELFKGLYIYDKPFDWKSYPIIHIDLGNNDSVNAEELEIFLRNKIATIARSHKIELFANKASELFQELIEKLFEKQGSVVILIDEYDKPILNNITDPKVDELQRVMKGFYSVLKTCEKYERFVFITGVGKFLKTSIFSDLNNLVDISMSDEYASMCGYTETEFKDNLHCQLTELANKKGLEYKPFLAKIKKWYDGYKFSKNGENVYNPVSLSRFINDGGEFENYWFETGSPSFILKLLRKRSYDVKDIIEKELYLDSFSAILPSEIDVMPFMYQTGYLTIKETTPTDGYTIFRLGFPNFEVESSFYRRLLANATTDTIGANTFWIQANRALVIDDMEKLMSLLDAFLAGMPQDIHLENEKYYQSIFYAIFKLLGAGAGAEVRTSDGRIDCTLETATHIYIFEFKMKRSVKAAEAQIKRKEYAKSFEITGKKIVTIAAKFSFKKHRLDGWKITETL